MPKTVQVSRSFTALALRGAVALFAACAGPEDACEDCGGTEGEGEGEGECISQPSPAWQADAVAYEACAYPEVFDAARCADDACVSGDEEESIASAARAIAADRGYGARWFLTDVRYENDGVLVQWGVSWVIVTDWFRCTGSVSIDDNADDAQDPATSVELRDGLPESDEVPAAVPAVADVNAALAVCGDVVDVLPCISRCDALAMFVIDGERCAQADVPWTAFDDGTLCEGIAPDANL